MSSKHCNPESEEVRLRAQRAALRNFGIAEECDEEGFVICDVDGTEISLEALTNPEANRDEHPELHEQIMGFMDDEVLAEIEALRNEFETSTVPASGQPTSEVFK